MRRSLVMVACGGLLAAGLAPSAAASPQPDETSPAEQAARVATAKPVPKGGKPAAPRGPNPYLALLPDPAKADFAGWDRYLQAKGEQRAERRDLRALGARLTAPIVVDEDEPEGERGSNDRPVNAQPVPGFGTTSSTNHRARLLGTLSPEQTPVEAVPSNAEDDGSIPLAGETGIGVDVEGVTTSGEIGDGPHGSAGSGSGDFDFYRLEAVAGHALTVDVDTPVGDLDPMAAVFDATGEMLAFNDDSDEGLDSFLEHTFDADGTYYVMVTGYPALPDDPFDSGSGSGAGSEGPYDVDIVVADPADVDVDFYSVRLRKGDVLGASVDGAAARLAVYDSTTVEVQGSGQDLTWIFPAQTPLPGGGNAVVDHVADRSGLHYVGVSRGDGDYDVTVEAYRPPLDSQRPVQTIFVDFDGARVNTNIWGGPGVRSLSPLRAFLARWGLRNVDQDRLITETMDVVRENIRLDMIASGLNPDFGIMVKNSRDHRDPFGQRNVSRVIVGGTIAQSGIATIGIAQSVDPGNFATKESALVLLDALSEAEGPEYSLNTYLAPESDRIGFVAQGLGNVISHEAGHFFGDWHVDEFNDQANLMDAGGNFSVLYGVGPDGVGGTGDDEDVDFGEDAFNPFEGFTGTEDTLSRLAFAITR